MIYRMIVDTTKKDYVRTALDKFFQDYIIIEADRYKNGMKYATLLVEVCGDEELAQKATSEIARMVGVPCVMQIIKNEPPKPKVTVAPTPVVKKEVTV